MAPGCGVRTILFVFEHVNVGSVILMHFYFLFVWKLPAICMIQTLCVYYGRLSIHGGRVLVSSHWGPWVKTKGFYPLGDRDRAEEGVCP